MNLYLLFESAAGYALFVKSEFDEAQTKLTQIQKAISQYSGFSKMIQLKAFVPFLAAEVAYDNIKSIQEGKLSEDLKNFLNTNLPKAGKKAKFALGVQDNKLANKIAEELQIPCKTNDVIFELFRGIRNHFVKFLKSEDFSDEDLRKAQLGLAHQSSRGVVSDNVNRQDKHIIQSSALLEILDKNLNTFCMRIKEWFTWHFPELSKIITDNYTLIRIINHIQNRETISDDTVEQLDEITGDRDISQAVIDAAKISMGQELSDIDTASIHDFTEKILSQYQYRNQLHDYLKDRMNNVAPNLTALIGENVGSRLISKAGSLVNLAKFPASTIQILGAEKALFRALKTRGNTPKYGLLYNSSFITKAGTKDKGKISRCLANKCALAARLDNFLIIPTTKFGDKMKDQVDERLQFLATGQEISKNEDIMKDVLDELKSENLYQFSAEEQKKKKKKKSKPSAKEIQEETEDPIQEEEPKKKKKKKVAVEE